MPPKRRRRRPRSTDSPVNVRRDDPGRTGARGKAGAKGKRGAKGKAGARGPAGPPVRRAEVLAIVKRRFAQVAKNFGRQRKNTTELASVVNDHSKNLEIQFQRIAQLQADLDEIKRTWTKVKLLA